MSGVLLGALLQAVNDTAAKNAAYEGIKTFLYAVSTFHEELLVTGVAVQVGLVMLQFILFLKLSRELKKKVSSPPGLHEAMTPFGFEQEKKLFLTNPLPQVVREWLRDEWEDSGCSRVGAVYTSAALVFTFLLIAAVLTKDVNNAIAIKDSTLSKKALSDAVGSMGAKFFISFSGVLSAVFIDHALFQAVLIRIAIARAVKTALATAKASVDQLVYLPVQLMDTAQRSLAGEPRTDLPPAAPEGRLNAPALPADAPGNWWEAVDRLNTAVQKVLKEPR